MKKKLLGIGLLAGGAALAMSGGKKKKKKKSSKSGSGSGGKLNQCDPLNPPDGKECFFDGERYVLRDISETQPYGGSDGSAMPEIASDQVAFSQDFKSYVIGATWRIRVLDNFLNIERLDGQLTLVKDGKEAAEKSRAATLERFFNQYNVQTVNGPVTVKDLPGTDAALEFVDLIDEYIGKFQRMTFD